MRENRGIRANHLFLQKGPTTFAHVFSTSLSRPWVLLVKEPIVLLLTIYLAIEYGTLYMLFSAYPLVYQDARGWSQGIGKERRAAMQPTVKAHEIESYKTPADSMITCPGGLAFLGVMVGMICAIVYSAIDNIYRYQKLSDKYKGFAPPEVRLPPAMVGGVAAVIGLFWFAWVCCLSVHLTATCTDSWLSCSQTDTPDIHYMVGVGYKAGNSTSARCLAYC